MPVSCEQDRIGDKAQQRKEDQAEYDRVAEEHRQRLATLAADAQLVRSSRALPQWLTNADLHLTLLVATGFIRYVLLP